MRRIIKNKIYDTQKALCVGGYQDAPGVGASLYRKHIGEYFLHIEVGKRGWENGERIVPITAAEARTWAKEHCTEEDYKNEFEVIHNEPEPEYVHLHILIDKERRAKLRNICQRNEFNLTQAMEYLIDKEY